MTKILLSIFFCINEKSVLNGKLPLPMVNYHMQRNSERDGKFFLFFVRSRKTKIVECSEKKNKDEKEFSLSLTLSLNIMKAYLKAGIPLEM